MQRIGAGEKVGLGAKDTYSLTSIDSEKPKGRLLSETQGLKPLKKDIALATINSTSDLEKTAPRKKTFRISSNTSSVGVGTTTEERRISANSSSKLPANDSQVEDKSAQAQSSQVSENNSITGDWSRKAVKARLAALPDALNQTQPSKQQSGTTLRLTDLGGNAQSEQKTETQLTLKLLNSRIKEDKKDYQEFLEALGLMRYYDELWELGVDTLEALANVDVEQLNLMKMPAGVQIKMQRELKKKGYQSEGEIRDMTVGTDANDSHIQITENPTPGSVKQAKVSNIKDGKLNFGIKVQKIEKTSESIGTDPLPFDDDIPLNINTDGGGGKVMIPSSLKTKLEASDSKSKSISQQAAPAEKFSFASLGDTNWDNLLAFQSDPSAFTLVDNNKQRNSMSNQTRPVTAKKVSCYSCYKSVPEDEAYTHRSLISKFFCSKECEKKETADLVATCPICFKVFEKRSGLPTLNTSSKGQNSPTIWVCSQTCKQVSLQNISKQTSTLTNEDIVQQEIQKKKRREEEVQYQNELRQGKETLEAPKRVRNASLDKNEGGDVDLDFEYH